MTAEPPPEPDPAPRPAAEPATDTPDSGVLFSIARIQSGEEYRGIPGIDVAAGYAESLNTLRTGPFARVLHREATYRSDSVGAELHGRRQILRHFRKHFRSFAGRAPYHAQVVVEPDGNAGVMTHVADPSTLALTRFVVEDARAVAIEVPLDFDRDALRETRYAPPEG